MRKSILMFLLFCLVPLVYSATAGSDNSVLDLSRKDLNIKELDDGISKLSGELDVIYYKYYEKIRFVHERVNAKNQVKKEENERLAEIFEEFEELIKCCVSFKLVFKGSREELKPCSTPYGEWGDIIRYMKSREYRMLFFNHGIMIHEIERLKIHLDKIKRFQDPVSGNAVEIFGKFCNEVVPKIIILGYVKLYGIASGESMKYSCCIEVLNIIEKKEFNILRERRQGYDEQEFDLEYMDKLEKCRKVVEISELSSPSKFEYLTSEPKILEKILRENAGQWEEKKIEKKSRKKKEFEEEYEVLEVIKGRWTEKAEPYRFS